MDAADRQHWHFTKFKASHRQMASVARIGKPHQTNGHSKQTPITLGHLPNELPFSYRLREWCRSWWYRLAREWEPVVVNKQIDSVTMPKWIAIGILGAVLTFGVQSWWKSSDQRDMLIRLETELRMSREFDAEKSRELKEQAELNKVHIDNITGELKTIKGMLTASQLSTLENIKRGNN